MITGQHQPTADIALFECCISLNFQERKAENAFTKEEQVKYKRLQQLEESGRLSSITAHLQRYRDLIQKRFDRTLVEVKDQMELGLQDSLVHTRAVNHYAYILAATKLIVEEEPLGFSYDNLMLFCMERIIEQSSAMSTEDEVTTWWRIFEFLIDTGAIHEGTNYQLKFQNTVKISLGGKSTTDKEFETSRHLLYINMNSVHGLYMKEHNQQFKQPGLNIEALRAYLKSKDYFVGICRGVRFNKHVRAAFVFDTSSEYMPIKMDPNSYNSYGPHAPPSSSGSEEIPFTDEPIF